VSDEAGRNEVSDWWRTAIIDMEPGRIEIRGRPIQQLIGELSFPQMIWLLVMGETIEGARATLLEAALVAAVDHGPQAPSIAIARMAVTCGVGLRHQETAARTAATEGRPACTRRHSLRPGQRRPGVPRKTGEVPARVILDSPNRPVARMAATCGVGLNNAIGSAVNVLGDVHGGAGEQAVELYRDAAGRIDEGAPLEAAVADALAGFRAADGRYVPGFGHRFHKPVDPRAPRLMALVDTAARTGAVSGRFADIGRGIETRLRAETGKPVPMNIDGATAVIYAELGCPPPLARGLFCLSRSVGILAHAWEQTRQGGRNKGPTPPQYRWTYEGPAGVE